MSRGHHPRRNSGPPRQHTEVSRANNQQRSGRIHTTGASRNRGQPGIDNDNGKHDIPQRNRRPQRGNPPRRNNGSQSGRRPLRNNNSNPPDGNNLAPVLRPDNSKHRVNRPKFSNPRPSVRDPNRPPPGFVFVPKGDVFITRKCTTLSSESGVPAEIVYDPTTHLRLGLYVHRPIHNAVLAVARATASTRAAAVERKDAADLSKARVALGERYVAMPAADMDAILARAFAKGSGNVGRTTTLDPARRASLAVEAHVRHTYTEYDGLLREGVAREEARRRIAGRVRGVKGGWRGDKGDVGNKRNKENGGNKGNGRDKGNEREKGNERNKGNGRNKGSEGNKGDVDTEMTGM
ncbi:hypothetical protein EV356DRAFT_213825 [Viridothelium virens]|uniref:DUF2293 domain-containing protein n=1 Tax=Viridothelium virens TaxID=1048519 RepID=A0A6A6H713_VIRVR|nr:hypothetical protein EV356DRAFT_213825 [Viridothelium virens]